MCNLGFGGRLQTMSRSVGHGHGYYRDINGEWACECKMDCTAIWCTCFAKDMFCTDMCRCSDLSENDGDCQKIDYQSGDDAEN